MPFMPLPRVKTLTADYQVLASDNGTIFLMSSGADIEVTLPAVAGGKNHVFEFYNVQDFEMLITAPDEKAIAFNDATADAISYTTAGEHIGASCRVIGTGAIWLAQNLSAGANTVTVVSA